MAKLGSFYSLCPLIDNKGLLDVSEDSEEGVVIVTLGKNIASRYKLSNQKQITCWRTKEKFSSPVIYHKNKNKYVAVFNQSHVKFWDVDDKLDKLKKYKFNKPIHSVIQGANNYFILFQNGSLYRLDEAIEDRKMLSPSGLDLKQIDQVLCTEFNSFVYIGIISENVFYWTKYEDNNYKFSKIVLFKQDLTLRGYTYHIMRNEIYLLTLWSDNSIFSRLLDDSFIDENAVGELFTVINCVSPKHDMSILSLDENYIGLYGANNNEEGAMLALYNVQFKVTQSQQPFKLFTMNTKIWKQGNNILLPVGHNLAVVPFHLETEQLAALVGSHKHQDPDVKIIQELDVASWDKNVIKIEIPDNLKSKIDHLVQQGLPESTILEELLPDIFKEKDVNLLIQILGNFSDVPETYLVNILNFALDNDNDNLINIVLRRQFSDVLILLHLRSDLSTNNLLALLKHIEMLWSKNKTLHGLNFIETHAKLVEWICILIDSNYQKMVLSNDKLFFETLTKINELVNSHLESLEVIKNVEPLLSNFKRNKIVNGYSDDNLGYSIEQFDLY